MSEGPEPDAIATAPVAGEGELHWFSELGEHYWVPGSKYEGEEKLFPQLRDVLPDATPPSFLADLERALENVDAVRDFLEMPYDVVLGTIARVVENADSGQPRRAPMQLARAIATVLQSEQIKPRLDSMMRQAVVLLWGAYETFSRDLFVSVLNEKPSLVSRLVVKKPFKDRFPLGAIFNLESLEAAGFDLNGKLGSLLAEGKDFSAPWMLRSLFPTLFEGSSLQPIFSKTFEAGQLWMLGHRRHVVAHRCGIVDGVYMRESGDKAQSVGAPLKVTRKDFRDALSIVRLAIATAVASAAELFGPLKEIPD